MVVDSCQNATVARTKEAVRSALIQRNADVCREADCTRLDIRCHSNSNQSGHSADRRQPVPDVVDVVWTILANYSPIEDYFYEGVDVPEAESLIEKLQVSISIDQC